MAITKDHFVACSYDLYAGRNEVRDLIEQATPESPMQYMHGIGMMIPAFESKLEGLNEGDTFDFELSPAEAYGEVFPDRIVPLDKSIFVNDEGVFDAQNVVVGARLPMMTEDQTHIEGLVTEITDDKVTLDFNHPLAGMHLHFEGKVLQAHPATDEEREEIEALLQPQHSCGCDCGCHDDEEGGSCDCGGGSCDCGGGGSCHCH